MPLPPMPPRPAHVLAQVPISVRVAQSGAFTGIRNTVFTTWLPPGSAFAGLSGRITFAGNHAGFNEALVMLGFTDADRNACARQNGAAVPDIPAMNRLWAAILKANDPAPVDFPVAMALPVPVAPPRPEVGACLTTLVSAGYPFLRPDLPLYATTTVQLNVAIARPGPEVMALGLGGEFKFPTGSPVALQNYVGIRAERPMVLEAIAASISAAPVTGAPMRANWGPALRGRWRITTAFVQVPAPLCAAARYEGHPVNRNFSILRMATPQPIRPPSGSIGLLGDPLDGVGAQAAQSAPFAAPSRPVRLGVGDCLIVFQGSAPGTEAGSLDVENQSTVYLIPE